jgi:NO-binding membrane sensor protein with MHYT domain
MGTTIWSMHFIAMAHRLPVVASIAGLGLHFYRRSVAATVAGGVVQGLAIASMHYTAMAATNLVQLDVPAELTTPLFSRKLLAFLMAGAMLVVCTGNLAMLGVMSLQQIDWFRGAPIGAAATRGLAPAMTLGYRLCW